LPSRVPQRPRHAGGRPAAQRAIALVAGTTRSDGMSFDEWYRARLNRLGSPNSTWLDEFRAGAAP